MRPKHRPLVSHESRLRTRVLRGWAAGVRRVALCFAVAAVTAIALLSSGSARAERLRDLVSVEGARENQLIGYGIVVGLAGTGDNIQVPLAQQSLTSLLTRLGIKIDGKQLQLRNVAAVMVIGTLPPFAKNGTRIDITVASTGNATSIVGGMLLQTVLKGADQNVYAVAQGNVVVGGFSSGGNSGSSVKAGITTAGRIPEGALIEREVKSVLVKDGRLRLELRQPAFGVAAKIVEAVDRKLGSGIAQAPDSGSVFVKVPGNYEAKVVELIAMLEELEVTPTRKARVVINERTGTIVASGDVRLAPVAIMHGNLTIVVKETPTVSQPNPTMFGNATGTTTMVPRSDIEARDGGRSVTYVPGATSLADVASALNALGLPPREMASVLQALRTAGSLEAELEVQ